MEKIRPWIFSLFFKKVTQKSIPNGNFKILPYLISKEGLYIAKKRSFSRGTKRKKQQTTNQPNKQTKKTPNRKKTPTNQNPKPYKPSTISSEETMEERLIKLLATY